MTFFGFVWDLEIGVLNLRRRRLGVIKIKISCCWLYAISKYGYPPSMKKTYQVLKEMSEMGFKYGELEGVREENLEEVAKNKKELKRLCDSLGLKIVNFCPVLPDLINPQKKVRKKALFLFEVGIEIANYFNCYTIQTDSYTPPLEFIGKAPYKEAIIFGKQFKVKVAPKFRWDNLWSILVESISVCNRRAKEAKLKFCLEPRVGENVSNTDALLRLMREVDDDNFGAVLDTGHLHAQKEILPLSIEKLGKRIFYLHVSDNDGRSNEHLGLGKGTIDWEGVFLSLKKHKFKGYVAIDIGGVPQIEREYKETKKYLERIEKKLGI